MNIALILSGGSGIRLGGEIPKQYIGIEGKPLISYCLDTIFTHSQIDAVQIVADKKWNSTILDCIHEKSKMKGFSLPGKNRQLSILNGLEDIKKYAKDTDYVLIHDAARPLISEELINECLRAIEGYDGVLPVLSVKDTLYYSTEGKCVDKLLERELIYAGQAPEVFLLGKYYEANKRLLPTSIRQINGSTEPAILAGLNVTMIPGDERNFKITTQVDMERLKEILRNDKRKVI